MTDKRIIVCGNGVSRKRYNFIDVKKELQCPLWACNLAYLELPADLIFSVDDDVIEYLKKHNVNLANYDENLKLESIDYDPIQQRNSAGMVAIQHAISLGYKEIYIYGFDSVVCTDDDDRTSNCFSGMFYNQERQCSVVDTYRRQLYFNWIRKQNPDVKFYVDGQRV